MNCRSVVNKVAELLGLIESVNADIVLGTESWLKPSIADSEVFPQIFVVYRKDRLTAGGCVFYLFVLAYSHLKLIISATHWSLYGAR